MMDRRGAAKESQIVTRELLDNQSRTPLYCMLASSVCTREMSKKRRSEKPCG